MAYTIPPYVVSTRPIESSGVCCMTTLDDLRRHSTVFPMHSSEVILPILVDSFAVSQPQLFFLGHSLLSSNRISQWLLGPTSHHPFPKPVVSRRCSI